MSSIQLNQFPPDWLIEYVVLGANMSLVWYWHLVIAQWVMT